MNLIESIRAAKDAGDPALLVSGIPYARFLGITAAAADGALTCRVAAKPENYGNPVLPAVHGGIVGALMEMTAILQLLWLQESVRVPKTITITIDYLRSAHGDRDTFARADVTKLGARVANVRALAWQEDPGKPVASANANFLVVPAAVDAAKD
jgi:uncharacterized protein (TIGR00369 family)